MIVIFFVSQAYIILRAQGCFVEGGGQHRPREDHHRPLPHLDRPEAPVAIVFTVGANEFP